LDEKFIADLVLTIQGHLYLKIVHFCNWDYMPGTRLKWWRQILQ